MTPPPAQIRNSKIEQFGIEQIPDSARDSSPVDLFRIIFGGGNTFATVLLGTIPIAFGLSFADGFVATVIGLAIGAVFLAPMALFGPRNGTNNAVSSGAHFGVVGRIIGSFLALLTSVTFFALGVWVSGDAFVGGVGRAFGIGQSALLRGSVYAIFGLLVIVVCVYGFRLMLWFSKLTLYVGSAVMIVGVVALHSRVDWRFPANPASFIGNSHTATMVAAVVIAAATPISFGALLGDWSRYIPDSASKAALLGAPVAASFALLLPLSFGLLTATMVPDVADYTAGLITITPLWYAAPLMIAALSGGIATGATSLYGTGLDFSSVFPRLSRVQATISIGLVSFVFVMVGRFVIDLTASVNAFATLIVVCTTPWMAIMALGYIVRRGYYDPDALQVFNRGQTGGRYWFHGGWNYRALCSWLTATIVALLFANVPPLWTGPFSNAFGGPDVSIPIAIAVTVVTYGTALVIAPEPAYVFGPTGPLLGRLAGPAQAPPKMRTLSRPSRNHGGSRDETDSAVGVS